MNVRSDTEAVVDGMLGTGLEGTSGETSLAAGTSGRLDASNGWRSGVGW